MTERPLPNYKVVPLRSEEISVVVVQSRLRRIDVRDPARGRRQNLDYMLWWIDRAQKKRVNDLIIFHEFPLEGTDIQWNREEQLKIAIDVPGEETEIIGQKAKKYNCYIAFGCRGKLNDWPGHFHYLGLIVDPSGNIVHRRWKLRNMPGIGFPTTVYDVLNEYVKRYGWDEVFPVARTDIGNIAIFPEIQSPEIGRAFAIKGAEILIRYMTSGAGHFSSQPTVWHGGLGDTNRLDLQATCLQNGVYGVFVNAAMDTENFIDIGTGRSAIYDFDGNKISEVISPFETMIHTTIPIASYRKKHSIPNYPIELFAQLNKEYISKYEPDSYLKQLPANNADALKLYRNVTRW